MNAESVVTQLIDSLQQFGMFKIAPKHHMKDICRRFYRMSVESNTVLQVQGMQQNLIHFVLNGKCQGIILFLLNYLLFLFFYVFTTM